MLALPVCVAFRPIAHASPPSHVLRPQRPLGGERTELEDAAFRRSLEVMADVYASAVGTTVLQIQEIPEQPPDFTGVYNIRPYFERGWCCFEDAVSRELLAMLRTYPRMEEALHSLPSKVLLLREDRLAEEITLLQTPCELQGRVAGVIERIGNATFAWSPLQRASPCQYPPPPMPPRQRVDSGGFPSSPRLPPRASPRCGTAWAPAPPTPCFAGPRPDW